MTVERTAVQRTLTWRKSSYSGDPNGDCVEVAWRKSSYSGDPNGNCVEVARAEAGVLLRDSKNIAGPVLAFPVVQWRAVLNARHKYSPRQPRQPHQQCWKRYAPLPGPTR